MKSFPNITYIAMGLAMLVLGSAAFGQNLDLSLTYTDANGNNMPYRLFVPQDMTGADVPVVLFLHGAGEKGSNNTSQINSHVTGLVSTTQGSEFSGILVAPQLPDQGSNRWFNTVIDNGNGTSTTAFDMVLGMVDKAIADYDVDVNRQYLTGLSLGGEGTWVLAQENSDRFAAIAPMSGRTTMFTWDVDALKEIPTWVFHGDEDNVVPYVDSLQSAEETPLLRIAGKTYAIEGLVHRIERLCFADGVPMMLERRYVSAAQCPDIDQHDLTAPLYELYENTYNLILSEVHQDLSVVTLDSGRTMEQFELDEPIPAIRVQGATLSSDGQIVELEDAFYRSDRYRFTVVARR